MADEIVAAYYLYYKEVIDEHELLLLMEQAEEIAAMFQYWKYNRFDLPEMNEDECKSEFSFRRNT